MWAKISKKTNYRSQQQNQSNQLMDKQDNKNEGEKKQLHGYIKWETKGIVHELNWSWLWRGNL